jgi:hypothetical protein
MSGRARAGGHVPPITARRDLVLVALAVWLPLTALLVIALVTTSATDITLRQLTQDATTVLEGPFYVGILSNVGLLLWSATVTVCFLVAVGLETRIDRAWRRFLVVSGAFTAVLLVDDLALIHDDILPNYVGISGEVYGVAYVLFMLGYLVSYRHRIRQTDWTLLIVALGFFGVSTVVDLGSTVMSDLLPPAAVVLVEDGAKLLGIGTWLAYFVSVARQLLAPVTADEVVTT